MMIAGCGAATNAPLAWGQEAAPEQISRKIKSKIAPVYPELARRVQKLLAPLPVKLDGSWGLDHGTWSVLKHAYPDAKIPVVQLSIDGTQAPEFHYETGKRLAPLRDEGVLVAGSGLMGIAVLSRPGFTEAASLAGQPVGTFRADPMEVLLHDVLATVDLRVNDVRLRYFEGLEESIEAFRRGELAALTLAEPFAERLRREGAHTLSDGTELWGDPFPDTVLVASAKFLRERPEQVRASIRAMLRAEALIHADPRTALRHALRFFPGFDLDELAGALSRQPSRVDIRELRAIVFGRWDSLRSLDLVPAHVAAPLAAVAFELLERELALIPVKENR